MVVFGLVGVVVAAGGNWLISAFPIAGLAIGILMIAVGSWLALSGETLSILAASRITIAPKRNLLNGFLFGIVYAIGSLSCTLPIFLVVVGSGLSTRGFGASLGQFVSYASGMGVVLIGVTAASAAFGEAIAGRLKALIPYIGRASALFLIGAGGYLVYYWVFFAEAFAL
jgi:cytochrome c biogenesis protein CcdA